MSPEDAKSLESWVALSREMVELAQAREWDSLAKRESVRQQQIRAFFQKPVSTIDADRLRASIEQVQAMDQTVQQLAKQARDEAARMVMEQRRGSLAIKAYAVQSRMSGGKK